MHEHPGQHHIHEGRQHLHIVIDRHFDDLSRPIKDQGIVKSPVRIGPDVWMGTRVTILRGSRVGRGSVLGAHAVVRGRIPPYSVAVGAPARVVNSRKPAPVPRAPRLR